MFRKLLVAAGALCISLTWAASANAGVTTKNLTIAGNPLTITTGEKVTFTYTYSCDAGWTSAQLQLFTSTGNLGDPVTIAPEELQDAVYSQSVRIMGGGLNYGNNAVVVPFDRTFTTGGRYVIDARVTATVLQNSNACDVASTQTITVQVNDPVTTTAAPTTTVAPTTTKKPKEALPETGSSNNGTALLAITVVAAGATVILARRRLLQ